MARARPSRIHPSEARADLVRAIVARTCGTTAVVDEHDLARDLYLDSDAKVELTAAIELAFGIDFAQSDAVAVRTVADLVAAVERKSRRDEPDIGDLTALIEAIKDLAAGAASTGDEIDAASAAALLSQDYPHSGLTLDDIAKEVERAAAEAGARIAPGGWGRP